MAKRDLEPYRKTGGDVLLIDPEPMFDLSKYLYMQFMEPLGTTDASVEAGWDFRRGRWRDDFVQATRELAPTLIRWPGGCFSSYYRWAEGVGTRSARRPMLNLCWGGVETNQVGTHEFIDFCRLVGADPLIAVNFESDGRKHWARPPEASVYGGVRSAGPKEAAAWVQYCNRRRHARRSRNGSAQPFGVRLWQIGNETSYGNSGYDRETAARRTLAFAKAMRKADPDIELIGWGDSGWAGRMLEVAGEHLRYLAFHPHFDSGLKNSPLRGNEYRKDPDRTWRHLMHAHKLIETKLSQMRREIRGSGVGLAITESHFYLYPRNQCNVLRSWAAGVANARVLNVHARNGDILKIATAADFCGNRWTVNAVMIPTPGGRSYLMPVARVMALFRKHVGKKAVRVESAPKDLDVTASRTGRRIFMHVVNVNRTRSVRARVRLRGMAIVSARAFEIADDPASEIYETEPDLFAPKQRKLPVNGKRLQGKYRPGQLNWTFPPASVTAVELEIRQTDRRPREQEQA